MNRLPEMQLASYAPREDEDSTNQLLALAAMRRGMNRLPGMVPPGGGNYPGAVSNGGNRPPAISSGGADPLINALFTVESSSSLDNPNWGIRGPTVPTGMYAGERAIGPAQIMPGNIPSWSEQHLGQRLDPNTLAAGLANGDPAARDAYMRIVQGEVGRLQSQGYSPEEIAIAWHSGEGGVRRYREGRGSPRDTATGIGTFGTGDTYVGRFMSAYR